MIRSGNSQRDLNNQGGLLIVSGSFTADCVLMAVLSSLFVAFRLQLASAMSLLQFGVRRTSSPSTIVGTDGLEVRRTGCSQTKLTTCEKARANFEKS